MVRDDWVVGQSRRAAAAERIYAAATDLIVSRGLDAFDIDTLAARVHCSRATIYRYAGGKAQIRDAVLMRLSSGIVDTVRDAVDGLSGAERVVTAITVALEQIRANPLRPMMLDPRTQELGRMHTSPLLSRLAADLTGITDHDPHAAQWIVRVVMSFAHWPLPDNDVEQRMIRSYVAPAFNS
ncbi:TetR/AcrR family transcriptional regulator [Nocardia sp. NPDC019395]|uniref:TetR/AcrR family transcriptional regulator n=1 Tax=Nocardia sp. NPDC019395 TaxID=3154686 RepID=UPI0033C31D3F